MDEYEEAILFTLNLLDSRLDRLSYVLGRTKEEKDGKSRTVTEQVHDIEKALQDLSARTELINDVQQLLIKHKDVLKPKADVENTGLSHSQKAALIVNQAPAFASIASQFKALDDQAIPSTDGFVKLSNLRPRIAQIEAHQLEQALALSDLRRRSALLVQRVKQVQVVGAGRCWTEWHRRLQIAERTVARAEYRLKQSDD